jgi:hypothetical protein
MWCNGVDGIHLAQVRGQLGAIANPEINKDLSFLSWYALSTGTSLLTLRRVEMQLYGHTLCGYIIQVRMAGERGIGCGYIIQVRMAG